MTFGIDDTRDFQPVRIAIPIISDTRTPDTDNSGSGGTGLTGRDVTPEAVSPLFDRTIDGLSTLKSRAIAGVAKSTLIFCLPASNGGVKDGWDEILVQQLDNRYRPCNFVGLLPRLSKSQNHNADDTP